MLRAVGRLAAGGLAPQEAARILADVATREHLGHLAALLDDPDAEVRVSAATALVRLAGRRLGDPEALRGDGFARVAEAWRGALAER